MAGPRPDDPYSGPTATVAPSGAPDDMLSVRANPNEMGAQVGAAFQKAGEAGEKSENQWTDLAIQYQGMLNETASTNAASDFSNKSSDIHGKYKALKGLDAVAQLDAYKQQIHEAWQEGRNGLNSAARRAYDMQTLRQQNLIYQDMATYSATQIKDADTQAAKASIETWKNLAAKPSTPMADVTANIKFDLAHIMTNDEGYASGISGQDPKTGDLQFTHDVAGQQAQAVWNAELQAHVSGALTNRIETLASDPDNGDPKGADAFYQANKDQMTPDDRAKVQAYLMPKVRAQDTRDVVDNVMTQARLAHSQELEKQLTGQTTMDQWLSATTQQESGGRLDIKQGRQNKNQIQPGTWSDYAKPGEVITNDKDNDAVARRYGTAIWNDPKVHGDPIRASVAYFSGLGNVNPDVNSPVPYLDGTKKDASGKTVASYAEDQANRLGGASAQSGYYSTVDYLRTHEDDLVEQSVADYVAKHPNDAQGAEEVRSQTMTRIQQQVSAQENRVKADADQIWDWANGKYTNGIPPSDVDYLERTGPDNIRAAWAELGTISPLVQSNIRNKILTTAEKRATLGYGTDMWSWYQKVADGEVKSVYDILKTNAIGDTKTSPLTPNSLQALQQMFQDQQTQSGRNFLQAEKNFFKSIRGNYTGTGGKFGPDPVGDGWFTNAMVQAMDLIREGRGEGKTAQQLFSPDSPDYIGNHLSRPTITQLAQNRTRNMVTAARMWGVGPTPPAAQQGAAARQNLNKNSGPDMDRTVDPKNFIPAADGKYYPNLKALHAATEGNNPTLNITQAIEYARANKLVQPAPPEVPKPH